MKSSLRKLFPPLARRVIGVVGIALLLAGSVFVYIAQRTGYQMLEEQVREKAHGVVDVGSNVLKFVMLDGKTSHLYGALQALNSSHQVRDVLVLRNDGSVFLRLDSLATGNAIPLDLLQPSTEYPGEYVLSLNESGVPYEFAVVPLQNAPACHQCHDSRDQQRGYLAVKVAMSDILATTSKHRTSNILMVVGIFLGVGGIIVAALLFFVIRPVTRLRNQMKMVGDEIDAFGRAEQVTFSGLAVPSQKDEISDLIGTFNKLIARLNDAYGRLHDVHEQQLEHADRLSTTGEMAASIAHEIRNPIAGVLGALQVILDDLPANDSRREILEEMKIQVERVNHAVNDLLSYARPTAPVFEDVSLQDVINRTSAMLSQQMHDKNIAIIHSMEIVPVMMMADRKQLQQVLWNIMLNGLQAMGNDGTMTVTLSAQDGWAEIQIIDTGKGIPPEYAEKIFKPFFTTKHKGTGLGMTISKRIVEQHEGVLAIASTGAEGTTVSIRLPLRPKGRQV